MRSSRGGKLVGIAIAAVLVFGALTAQAEATGAPRWKVEGSFLGAGVEKAFSANLKGVAKLDVPGLLTLVAHSCQVTGKIVGSGAGVAGTIKEAVLHCEEIEVPGAPACVVEPITTEKLSGQLTWAGTGEAAISFGTEFGGPMNTEVIEECALEGEYPISGTAGGAIFPVESEAATGEIAFTPATSALSFGGRPTTVEATFEFALVSGEKTGIFPG